MKTDARSAATPISPSRSVLLIDDEPRVIEAVAQIFALRGWTTLTPADDRQRIPLYDQARPDLVMLDLGTTGLNGMPVLHILRDHDPDATILVLSGQGDVNTAVEAMQFGAEGFLELLQSVVFELEVEFSSVKDHLLRIGAQALPWRAPEPVTCTPCPSSCCTQTISPCRSH